MFSLGLVSAGNIDAVCGEDENLKDIVPDKVTYKGELIKLLLNHHSKEFKIDNKESICAYMNVYDLSFLNTQLTQDDIEQFERYMAEIGQYENYERRKEFYTRILKLFTYYRNHISYKTLKIYEIDSIGGFIKYLQKSNGKGTLERYVYGKYQGNLLWYNSFDDFKNKFKNKNEVAKKTTCSEATANSKEELVECAKNKKILPPPIVKWAESNMKQSKPKDSK